VRAKREVILCAGAVNTPWLLMLSGKRVAVQVLYHFPVSFLCCHASSSRSRAHSLVGVGPKEELEKHKIPIVADLPVGKNLQVRLAMLEDVRLRSSHFAYTVEEACVCVCVYARVCVWFCVRTCVCVVLCTHVCVKGFVYARVCVCVCTHVCVCVCMLWECAYCS
jgi:hypothetical protein